MRIQICMAALVLVAGAAWAAPATLAVLAEAETALDKGDAQHTIVLANGALAEGAAGSDRAQLLFYRGLAQELLGAHDAALADLGSAIANRALPRDDRAQALLQRGFLLDGLNRLDDAVRDYSAVIALKTPEAATAYNNRANIWRRQGKLDAAQRDYLAALAAGSDHPQYPFYGLGQIAEVRHDKYGARAFYAKAVAADPSYRLASERLAELGGPPEAMLDEPDMVHLHPPASARKPPVASRIVLKPPPRRTSASLRPALDSARPSSEPQVQLGAWRSRAEAQAGWRHAQAKAGAALAGLSPLIVQADLPGRGTYFRLRIATPNPAGLCDTLRQAGQDCLPARD